MDGTCSISESFVYVPVYGRQAATQLLQIHGVTYTNPRKSLHVLIILLPFQARQHHLSATYQEIAGASFAALVERDSNSSTTSAGSFWLVRPNTGATIGHPRIAVIAAGWV